MTLHTDIHRHNWEVYLDRQIISEYLDQDYLAGPERKVIELLKGRLPDFTMLDIAVGGGRTTFHFAPLVKRYVGIDYSQEMIDACKKRFAESPQHLEFIVADMSSLEPFADDTFDFILISYNAISTLSHEDRLKTYSEIHRVLRSSGYLFFSAHNLQWVPNVYLSFLRQISWNHPKHTYWNLQKWFKAYKYNDWSVLMHSRDLPYATINDGAHDFRLLHYYIQPAEQIRQLSGLFSDVQVFALDGHEIVQPQELGENDDGYLYYLCTNTK